jgi:hypothetical protein
MQNDNLEDKFEDYIVWEGKKVKIPKNTYNAGGVAFKYTPDKVIEVLEFMYKHLLKGNLCEAISEEQEDSHYSELFDIAAIRAIREKPSLAKYILPYLRHQEKRKEAYKKSIIK